MWCEHLLTQAPGTRITVCNRRVSAASIATDLTHSQEAIIFTTEQITSAKAMASVHPTKPPPPSHILETCLYVRDMTRSVAFYTGILGLQLQIGSPRLAVFPLGKTTLILFQLGMTASDSISESGVVPGHGPDERTFSALTIGNNDQQSNPGQLHTHYCLAVSSREEVQAWEEYFKSREVKLRGTMHWQKGGKSVYFEDPDGHIGEIGSRGIWEHW